MPTDYATSQDQPYHMYRHAQADPALQRRAADAPSADSRATDERALLASIAPFRAASVRRSLWQFGSTLALFIAVCAAMYGSLHISVLLTFALAIPAAGLTVRLFIIQHDCGHGGFFRRRWANDAVGRFCSVITHTPYAFWRRQHAGHHTTFNNLDRRDTGIDLYSTCLTVREYNALPRREQWLYRLSRHPLVTQLVLPPIVFLIVYRWPFDTPRAWRRERASVWLTDLAILSVLAVLMLLIGIWPVVLVQLPIMVIASIIGVWLFAVQHRFEASQWLRQQDWTRVRASLQGSSFLKLPRILQWFTGNIGFHHIHHLASGMPNYRLQECFEARPELAAVPTLTLREAFRSPFFALWDEDRQHMVPFPRGPSSPD